MRRYHIPCLHERKRKPVPYTVPVDDYHPLTRPRIKRLLLIVHRKTLTLEEVRIRLHQGVEGYTCPRPLQGAIAERLSQISRLVDSVALDASVTPAPVTDELVEQCFALMHFHHEAPPSHQ